MAFFPSPVPRKTLVLCALMACTALAMPAPAWGTVDDDRAAMLERLARLEAANAALASEIATLRSAVGAGDAATVSVPAVAAMPAPAPAAPATTADARDPAKLVGIEPAYGFAVLDHKENVNRRTLLQLEARQAGELDQIVTLSGRATVIANAHWSNRANKFGYLMRHPSGNNQRTKATQEITISSAQLAATFAPTADVTGYIELLYDPEQSFGAGTLTTLARNQVQVRKAHVMLGNLDKSPFYLAAGKMDVPFGLQDTVSPFTNSTNWHAFAPLAYGGQVGYYDGALSLRGMAVVGGAQFRAANTPVDGTNIPSKLNNFAIDGSYTLTLGDRGSAVVGASYLHGSAYCQPYPVFHFNPCPDNVPAWAAYGRVDLGRIRVLGEFAETTKPWPGTQVPVPVNPMLAGFAPRHVTSFTVGGRYNLPIAKDATDLSFEFSKYIAGPEGAPWERQNQWVAGLAHRLGTSVDLFGEFIRVDGFVPLNFLSGGNQPNGATWSEKDARSHVIMLGIDAAF
jgi:hypothetical protein